MNNKIKSLFSIVLAIIMLFSVSGESLLILKAQTIPSRTACTVHPNGHTDGQSSDACNDCAPYAVLDNANEFYFGAYNSKWSKYYADLNEAIKEIISAMIRREANVSVLVAIDTTDNINVIEYIQNMLFDVKLGDEVDPILSGDYLYTLTKKYNIGYGKTDISDYDNLNCDILFYEVNCTFEYIDTAKQEEILKKTAEKWSKLFIENSPEIKKATSKSEKEYLIVKTIYNFICDNTKYDNDAYMKSYEGDEYVDWQAHSPYTAFFGKGAESAQSLEKTGYDWSTNNRSDMVTIDKAFQGQWAVCEGYVALFHYLCEYNGVDSRIVVGTKPTYIANLDKTVDDQHAWNYVYLSDGGSANNEYKWFQLDATYASINSIEAVHYTNYYYFLCGSQNSYFTIDGGNHQEVEQDDKTKFNYPDLSSSDYSYATYREELNDFDYENNYVAIMRKSENGAVDRTDYLLVKLQKDGSCIYFRQVFDDNGNIVYDKNGDEVLVQIGEDDGLKYIGETNVFFMIIPGYVYGGEYTTYVPDRSTMYEPGEHSVIALDPNSETQLEYKYIISRIDISTINPIVGALNGQGAEAIENKIPYCVDSVTISFDVVDGFGKQLNPNQDYDIIIKDSSGTVVAAPTEPGKYNITIDASKSSRYKGTYVGNQSNGLCFEITKLNIADLGFKDQNSIPYGYDVSSVMSSFTYTGRNGKTKTFTASEDYNLSFTGSTVNATSAKYTISANSKYLTGTVTKSYTILPRSISAYAGATAFGAQTYTGSPIKPTDLSAFEKAYGLKKDVDFTITSYSSNTNAGTAYVTITGKGNYTGTAQLKFTISQKSITDSDVQFKYSNLTTSSATVTMTYKNKTLNEGTDYKKSVSTKGKDSTLTVTGIGNFKSSISATYHAHTYKQVSSVAATYFKAGSKKYKCSTCSSTYTTSIAQLKPSLSSAKSNKSKQLTIGWKKCSSITGYQIQYSTSSKFTNSATKSVNITKPSTVSKTITKLSGNKKYYVRICVYSKSGSKTTYGAWSAVKSATTKK